MYSSCSVALITNYIVWNWADDDRRDLRHSPEQRQVRKLFWLSRKNSLAAAVPFSHRHLQRIIIIIIIIIKAIYNAQDPLNRPQMRYPAVRKCCCLYTMYHINNNVFSCVLKVVRLQSDIRNAVDSLSPHSTTFRTGRRAASVASSSSIP